MADSVRKQIIDAIQTSLESISGIGKVTQQLESWWDWDPDDFPGITIIDTNTDVERLAYDSTSADDRENDMSIIFRGYIFDDTNTTLKKRTDLIKDIHVELYNDTALNALILDLEPTRIETDEEYLDNFSVFDYMWSIKYHYNHNTP